VELKERVARFQADAQRFVTTPENRGATFRLAAFFEALSRADADSVAAWWRAQEGVRVSVTHRAATTREQVRQQVSQSVAPGTGNTIILGRFHEAWVVDVEGPPQVITPEALTSWSDLVERAPGSLAVTGLSINVP
jgi:hypothetical protein